MIIVSQDKNKIVNVSNLTQIYITQDEEKTGYYIRFETVDSLYDNLGEYSTEERAKEVLQEIIKMYKATESFKAISNRISDEVGAEALKRAFIYEMLER